MTPRGLGCCGSVPVSSTGAFVEVASKNLPEGSWAIVATANLEVIGPFTGDFVRDTSCELRSGTSYIGGATDRRVIPGNDTVKVSLSMNGGAQVPPGGGEVSLWCQSQNVNFFVDYGQMMMLQVGGFS